ncbi:uncharacterized protein LOC117299161 [Asterias rubens]|uniref:uncharacterized protein LOC117299161 n=1 Tax=Asterias rubens TaxID=7604 RepID=UPI00145548C5|nr:uncharacterized protein LOC117299161 [Asterias rubens]
MTLTDYTKCTNGEGNIVDGALTSWEKTLCKLLWRIEIIGKRSRTVVVLLTDGMKRALDLLTCKRAEAGIDVNNVYLFALRYGEGHLRGTDTVREHANLCEAKHPSYLRATRLRKHVATVSQIMNLQDNELDLLASFLGHDIRTHRQYYRLPESTLQVAKVSKVLLNMEKGNIQGLAGKSLQDIQLNPNEECDTDAESDTGFDSDQSEAEQSDAEPEEPSTSTGNRHKKGVCEKQGPKARRAWNSREKAAVTKHLGGFLKSRTVPGKAPIMKMFKAEQRTFSHRTWRNIKDFIRNQTRKKDPMGFLKI